MGNEAIVAQRERVEAPPDSFWESDLEMRIEGHLQSAADPLYVKDWLNRLNVRQRSTLCRCVGLPSDGSKSKQIDSLCSLNGQLTPYYLADKFAFRKSQFATIHLATHHLPTRVIEGCCDENGEPDKNALIFEMLRKNSDLLRILYQYEKIHKSGAAKMSLAGQARRPEQDFMNFLTDRKAEGILAKYDRDKHDGRASEYKGKLQIEGFNLVFIRRQYRPDFLMRGHNVVHGFKPEWIILDFQENGKSVNISSDSMDIPLEIANAMASAYFGKDVEYRNREESTHAAQIENLIDSLRTDSCEDLTLVEMAVHNSPLEGACMLTFNDEGNTSLSKALADFEARTGRLYAEINDIHRMKVLYKKKRISMSFEAVGDAADVYFVRYGDASLNAAERRLFEEKMREKHGIKILSTEKRHKR